MGHRKGKEERAEGGRKKAGTRLSMTDAAGRETKPEAETDTASRGAKPDAVAEPGAKTRLGPRRFVRRLKERISLDPKRFAVYSVLRILVIVTMVRCVLLREYENVLLCVLSLILFLMPALAEERLKIEIPRLFEVIIYFFIYASWILGEIHNYYVLLPGWDTMLHTMNGFLCAAVGFSLVDLLNQRSSKFSLSPGYLTVVAFCFSMTIGVLWEFIEFSADTLLHLDMQKDTIIHAINTVQLSTNGALQHLSGITNTVIHTKNGTVTVPGYLDIGLIDTMKDLFVNMVGALAFDLIGGNYVAHRSMAGITRGFLLRRESPAEDIEIEEAIDLREEKTYRETRSERMHSIVDGYHHFRESAARYEEEAAAYDSYAHDTPAERVGPLSLKSGDKASAAGSAGKAASADSADGADGFEVRTPGDAEAQNGDSAETQLLAWIGMMAAAAEGFVLYPHSTTFLNVCFLIIVGGMLLGLGIYLFLPEKHKWRGLTVWTVFCALSVCLTGYVMAEMSPLNEAEALIDVISILVNLLLPQMLWNRVQAESKRRAAAETSEQKAAAENS